MARRILTPMRYEEIKRLIELGRSDREIARSTKCSRNTAKGIRSGEIRRPGEEKPIEGPLWAKQVNWDGVVEDLRDNHPMKYIWAEQAGDLTSYANFWKRFYIKYPQYRVATSTHREFTPGERCEVDYAGKTLEWVDRRTGEVHEVPVFIGALGCCQKLFATVKDDMRSRNFLDCHNEMYTAFGGVPAVTVSDNLKQGVTKTHLYDPDINPSYTDLARHYGTAIVPARVRHPKDKALAEGGVKLVMRFFRFRYRHHTFTSITEIAEALRETVEIINNKPHTRFKISRNERWERVERAALKPLPSEPFEFFEYRDATLHPDSHLSVEHNYYSTPHIHRGKRLRVRVGKRLIEIFLGLERLAVHKRHWGKDGKFITDPAHLPENSKAYYEATPKNVLASAKYLNQELFALIDENFKKDAIGHLRRAQGFVRRAKSHVNKVGFNQAQKAISSACHQVRAYDKFRVPYFQDCLKQYHKQHLKPRQETIERKPNNPMLRYTPVSINQKQGELQWQ